MKNLKELKPILTCLYYINRTSENEDTDIRDLIEYAFERIFNCNTNLLLLACIDHTKETAMSEVLEILKQDTKFHEFLQRKERQKNETL